MIVDFLFFLCRENETGSPVSEDFPSVPVSTTIVLSKTKDVRSFPLRRQVSLFPITSRGYRP